MSIHDQLVVSGRRIAADPGGMAGADDLRARARRGRLVGVIAVSLVVVGIAAGLLAVRAGTPVPLDVAGVDEPDQLQPGRGASRVLAADGSDLGVLDESGDVVIDRVVTELLEDRAVVARLQEHGVTGERDERLALLVDAGLVIETSIRPEVEAEVSAVLDERFDGDGLGRAVIVARPADGRITSLVGAVDVHRQAGTAIQPIAMAAALMQGVAPTEGLPAPAELPIGGGHTTFNPGGHDLGELTLAEATANGAITPWASLVVDGRLPPESVASLARQLGWSRAELHQPAALAVVLGGTEVNLLELAASHAAFTAPAGTELHLVERVRDPNGNVVYDADRHRRDPVAVLDPSITAEVRAALELVVCCGTGTAAQLQPETAQFGQTGTTFDLRDAWFAGSTPELIAAVWVGQLDQRPPRLTGGSLPAEIWHDIASILTDRQ